jgi:hypothetical protein
VGDGLNNNKCYVILDLSEDDPAVAIPVNLKYPIRKKSEEKIMEEKYYQGEAMETLEDSLDNKMLGGNFSLKEKIEKYRILFDGTKLFSR